MAVNIAKLQSLATESLGEITARLNSGAITPRQWMQEMERTIVRGHTAATIGAVAERDGFTGKLRAWAAGKIGAAALPKADRQRLEASIASQRPYLTRFAQDVRGGNLTPESIARRADLYAGAMRATYSKARWADVKLPAHPADGSSECLSFCKCNWVLQDDGYYWTLGTAEHCPTCNTRASEWSPYRG